MKKIQNILTLPALVAVLSAASSYSLLASPVVLTFEGLQDQEQILNYYNGGFGGSGSGPGPNYGISFGADSRSIISSLAGGSGNFSGQPSGIACAFFLSGAGDVMDVPAGFNTGFSFYYSTFVPGSVTVWSGPDGTGALLASLTLPATGNDAGTFPQFNVWLPVGVAFGGTAESAIFTGSANQIGFDDITLGSQTPGNGQVPDGGTSALLLGMGLMGLASFSRRLAVAKIK